jgi:hypothetical protein
MRNFFVLIGFLAIGGLALAQDAPAPAPVPDPTPAPAPAIAGPAATMVESIKILFDDKAKTNGELRFEFTPAGGTAKSIRVTIAAKMNGKDVARDVAKELSVVLAPEFDVDRYDPDKIKIKAKKGNKKFSLTLAALTANGLSVRLK